MKILLTGSNGQLGWELSREGRFHYFEMLGVMGIFIKYLKENEVNKEFYENILADYILHFMKDKKRTQINVIKKLPVIKNKKGFFSRLFNK